MEIFKPRSEREAQQKNRSRKGGYRGAVIQRAEKTKQEQTLTLKKHAADILKNIIRVCSFKNSWLVISPILLIVISISFYSLNFLKAEMPIERVTVKGDFYQIDKQELENTLAPLVGSNYLDINIKSIKENLMNFAWVQSVEVRKIWPASLEVKVTENQAIATWGDDGFVNEFGQVFKPKAVNQEYLKEIPDLNGLDKQSDLVLSTYVKLSELSRRSNLKIIQFSLISNNYWRLTFDQGSQILLARGREQQSLDTFLEVYKQSFQHSGQHLAKVDMRYSNGFSVEFTEKESLEQNEMQGELIKEKQQQLKLIEQVGKLHG